MTEAEYIAAANLSRVRTIRSTLGLVVPDPSMREREIQRFQESLRRWEAKLEHIVARAIEPGGVDGE